MAPSVFDMDNMHDRSIHAAGLHIYWVVVPRTCITFVKLTWHDLCVHMCVRQCSAYASLLVMVHWPWFLAALKVVHNVHGDGNRRSCLFH